MASAAAVLSPVKTATTSRDRPRRRLSPSSHPEAEAVKQICQNAISKRQRRSLDDPPRVASLPDLTSRSLSLSYIKEFLHTSEWRAHLDRITIVDDAVPSFDELEGYGLLDEAEGTRACRKLFKAVVVWEQVGHSLWVKLRNEARKRDSSLRERRRSSLMEQARNNSMPVIEEQPDEPRPRRRSSSSLRGTRKGSIGFPFKLDRAPLQYTTCQSRFPPTAAVERPSCECCDRRATDPGPVSQARTMSTSSEDEDGRKSRSKTIGLPKKLSTAVRKTFGQPRARSR